MTCEACGSELSPLARSNRKYCSAACRRRAFRQRRVPAEPEFAPVVPITDNAGVAEAVGRAIDELRLVGVVAAAAGG